ncbi:uncharacterized protein LOC27207580 isoform X3 [Drosophila simulans]|uniref:uncharacterized protein LOC27207580 isoform X3 n=1 Tax=Drosophila simulans TaxID=7240 RepID=UPI001D121B3D|nr:uncharacterized protein LOC27207580 isoform X3 [Drosophila simulans]
MLYTPDKFTRKAVSDENGQLRVPGRERCQTKHKEMGNRREGQQPESGGEISLLPINQQVDECDMSRQARLTLYESTDIVSNLYHMYYIILYIYLSKRITHMAFRVTQKFCPTLRVIERPRRKSQRVR